MWSVAFSPDGHTLAATTDDGVATLWDLKVESAISRICAGSPGALSRQQWKRYVVPLPYDPPCVAPSDLSRRFPGSMRPLRRSVLHGEAGAVDMEGEPGDPS